MKKRKNDDVNLGFCNILRIEKNEAHGKNLKVTIIDETNNTEKNVSLYEGIKIMTEKGIDLDYLGTEYDMTLLHIATEIGDIESAKLLLENGADVNIKDKNFATPLHHATFNNYPAIVKLLLENGADVDSELEEGGTALHISAHKSDLEIAQLLVDHGADLHAKYRSLTPLDMAKLNKKIDFVQYLEPLMKVN